MLLPLAWRNLWRNGRRSLIVAAAVAVGVWSMLVFAGFIRGWTANVVNNDVKNLTGHGQIHALGFLEYPNVDLLMEAPAAALLEALDDERIAAWSTRVQLPSVIQSERESGPITLVGIDPAREAGLSFIADAIVDGRQLESADDTGLVLGRALATRLQTRVGKRVVTMTRSSSHQTFERGYRVVGLFAGASEEIETRFVFVGRSQFQIDLGLEERVTGASFMLADLDDLDDTVADLRAAAPDLDIATWRQLKPLTVAMLGLMNGMIALWVVVMFVVLSFGVVNTLLMAVLERTRELGLLQALGMRPRLLLLQVFLESVLLIGLGVGAGLVLGGVSAALMRGGIDLSAFAEGLEQFGGSRELLYPQILLADYVGIGGFVWVMGVVASLYPARRAAREIPIEALNAPT
jgi:ABC-type lipoprotein release transport system permease subunit